MTMPPQDEPRAINMTFETAGHTRLSRVPRGPPVLLKAHGALWIAVYRGYYALGVSNQTDPILVTRQILVWC
jgi:hypothetical protein